MSGIINALRVYNIYTFLSKADISEALASIEDYMNNWYQDIKDNELIIDLKQTVAEIRNIEDAEELYDYLCEVLND